MPVTTGKGFPITVLYGFLGSGKTTLLRSWKSDKSLPDPAFIVTDLSESGVDAELLSGRHSRPQIGQIVDRVADLHGLHARENLHTSVGRVLGDIANLTPAPSHVLYESTGTARPWPLITALTQNDLFHLRHFIVTIDALNLHRDFADGYVLTGEVGMPDDVALRYAAEILAEQILFASVIILTKTDVVPKTAIDAQVRVLSKIQPQATIGLSSVNGFSPSHLDVVPAPKLADLQRLAEQFDLDVDHPNAEVGTAVVQDSRPFHPQRLYDVFQRHLGTGIYRTKGCLWLSSRSEDVLLWQQSGSQIRFEHISAETSTTNQDETRRSAPQWIGQKSAVVHPIFGTRRNTLTIIGIPSACRIFTAALRSALCTEKEIVAWQSGEVFEDPWPQSQRHIR